MSLDVYESIRNSKITNLEVLCILSFLETISGPPRRDISGAINRSPNISILITIIRAIQKLEFEGGNQNTLSNRFESYRKISSYISSVGKDLDNITASSTVYSNMQTFILSWIELNMCETDLMDSSSKTLYHYAHLAIQRIYGVLLARETMSFVSRIYTSYRDSFKVSRSPTFNEELGLNDYTKWPADAVIPAFDKKGILRYITPFKMKVYAEDGVFWRELVGGDIVQQPSLLSIVQSFKDSLKAEGILGTSKPAWFQSLNLQYNGVYWPDTPNGADLVRSRDFTPGIPVDGKMAESRQVKNEANQTETVYTNPLFADQFIESVMRSVEAGNIIFDEILKLSPDVFSAGVELDSSRISQIARTFLSKEKILTTGLYEISYAIKSYTFNTVIGLALASNYLKVGIKQYYTGNPDRIRKIFKAPLRTNEKAVSAQMERLLPKAEKKQKDLIHAFDHGVHNLDHYVLVNAKYGYSIIGFLEGNLTGATATATALSNYVVGYLAKTNTVKNILQIVSQSKYVSALFTPGAFIAFSEVFVITALTILVDSSIEYVAQLLSESELENKRRIGSSLGYAPEAYAKYGIEIPMNQFGHLIDVSVLRQFLKRQELVSAGIDNKIYTGDVIEFVDRRFESYDWSKNRIIGTPVPEGLWPVNFAPLESIERAQRGVQIDFDRKIEKNQIDPNLKSVPPKDSSLLFPKNPWGVTPSICIPTFEDAAKEAVKNNILAQQDLNNIYEYNEFMNTVGKVVTTPEGLVPNISKITAISFAESYVDSLSRPLSDKLLEDAYDSISVSQSETDNGEFTLGTTAIVDTTNKYFVIRPHRRISQSEEVVFTSKPSIRPNSENKTKDGKNIPIGQRTSTSDYVRKSLRKYFPDNKITRPFNNDYNSTVPPITVKIPLPSFANGNGLQDVSSTNPLVRVLTQTERNAIRAASVPGSVSNIEDYILTDVSIKPSLSGPKLDTDLFEKECQIKRPERGDKPTRPDRDTGRDPYTGPGSRTCFPSYVKVLTPNGYVEISKMNVGDKISAFDENGSIVESVVTHKFIHDGEEISDVFEYKLSNGNKLHITDNHPVLVPSGEFLQIGWLSMGDSIIGVNGEEIQLISKEFVEKTVVYNLEVEKYHTYIAEGIRVHNLTNKWAGRGSGFDPRLGGRAVPGLILIDSSEWEQGGGQGDDTKNSESSNQEAVGSGRDNPFLPTCFPAWVSVKTTNGEMKLSDISTGMEILTYNRNQGILESSIVRNILKHEDNKMPVFRYELSNGNYLDTTKNHPVLTPNGYFTQIGKLNIGDSILSGDGTFVSIVNEYHLEDCFVYNLEVESNSSYVVNGIIVSDR